ncbi:MAG: hypothetical protein IIB56_17165 [Planctomycetes bacterium]|nr:hypothetical protein [Planctomycetota bacterium]MCH8120531.1 hypothetical protein [Planctomycetota bacterium]
MNLVNKIILVVFSVMAFLSTISWEANNEEFSRDFKRAITLRNSKDIKGLESLVKEIQSKWSHKNKRMYGALMVNTLNSWASAYRRADKKAPMNLIRQYAAQALSTYNPNKPDNISIGTEFALVSILHGQYIYTKGERTDEEWASYRRKGSERFFHAWRRLENAIDEDWDPNDIPVENVQLPEGAAGFPGMPPELIKDSVLRAEYEKAIERNREKIKIRNEQLKLRNIKKRYFRIVEKYLVSTYSILPYNNAELQNMLDSGVKDKKTKEQFLKAIEAMVPKEKNR